MDSPAPQGFRAASATWIPFGAFACDVAGRRRLRGREATLAGCEPPPSRSADMLADDCACLCSGGRVPASNAHPPWGPPQGGCAGKEKEDAWKRNGKNQSVSASPPRS